MQTAHVGVVGYGVIGKRVADAVAAQPDMQLVGVADVMTSALMGIATQKGYAVFAATPDAMQAMQAADLQISGGLPDLLSQVDIVVDCTPKGIPARNLPLYEQHNVKVIVEGGEKASFAETSFSSFANYRSAWGRGRVRVVSCNTTALCRILSGLDAEFGVEDAFVTLIRRAADPARTARGPINAIEPDLGPSHHFPDVKTCLPHLQGYSLAVSVPQTLSHVHTLRIALRRPVTTQEIRTHFANRPRIRLMEGTRDGLFDTGQTLEFYRDLGRPRYDHPEVGVWAETIGIQGNVLSFMCEVHMESIPIPENIDAIRSMLEMEPDRWSCIRKTDLALDRLLPNFAKQPECYDMQRSAG